jgi:hypothetical protein
MPARQCQPFSGTPLGYRVLGLLVCFQSTAHEPSSSSTFRSPSRHANRRSCLEHVLDFAASTALHCLGGTYVDHMCGRSRPAQSKASVQGVPSLCPKTEQAPRRAFSSYKACSMPQGKTRAPCQFLASLSSQIGWICPHGTIYLSYFPPPSRHQLIL